MWLLELVVAVSHGRPYHPQTQGKDERFRRTVVAEVIGRRCVADLAERQHRFAQWRVVYNTRRPHQALDLATPAARYRPSPRAFPEKLEPLDYGPGALVRRVDASGWLSCRNRPIKSTAASHCARPITRAASMFCSAVISWRRRSALGGTVNGSQRLAPVGLQGPHARRCARFAVAPWARGSLVWTSGTSCAVPTRPLFLRTPVHHVSGPYTVPASSRAHEC